MAGFSRKKHLTDVFLIPALVILVLISASTVRAKNCVRTSQCGCTFDDGSGTVNISRIGRSDGVPLIKDVPVKEGDLYHYSFNPCFPFTEGTCVGVAGCQVEKAIGTAVYYDIGDYTTMWFGVNGTNVVGTYTVNGSPRVSVVTYVCDPNADPPRTTVRGEFIKNNYGFEIVSKYACPTLPPTPTPTPTPSPEPVPPVIMLKDATISSGHLAYPDLNCLLHVRGEVESTPSSATGVAVGAKREVFICIKGLT